MMSVAGANGRFNRHSVPEFTEKTVLDLSEYVLQKIFASVEIEDFSRLSLSCRSFRQMAMDAYWDRAFSYSEHCLHPEKTMLHQAAKRLEFLFQQATAHSCSHLDRFFYRLAQKPVSTQINFSGNLFRAIKPNKGKENSAADLRYQALLLSLFNYPKSPLLCKMKVHQYAISMRLGIRKQLFWQTDKRFFEGAKLFSFPPFSFSTVPRRTAELMHVSNNQSFDKGEIVCVLDKKSLTSGVSSLFFACVLEKRSDAWLVSLEYDGKEWSSYRLKQTEEIAKIPFSKKIADDLTS